MSKNVGKIDRLLRIALVVAIAIAYLVGIMPSAMALFATIAGLVLIVTGTVGFCPLYKVCRISSMRSVK